MPISPLTISGAWMWSAWQPDRGMNFNSYLFERDDGCVAVDPLPVDDSAVESLRDLGGVHTVALTNRDHQRAAAALRELFGARIIAPHGEAALFNIPIDAVFAHDDEVFPGAFAIALPHGKTPGEVALHLPDAKAAVVGDALIGAPAGSVSLLPDERLSDPHRFLLGLRRLWALRAQCAAAVRRTTAVRRRGRRHRRVVGASRRCRDQPNQCRRTGFSNGKPPRAVRLRGW